MLSGRELQSNPAAWCAPEQAGAPCRPPRATARAGRPAATNAGFARAKDRQPGLAGHHGGVDVDSFLRDGFVAVRRADPATWPSLVRIDDLDTGPFTAAGLSPALAAAYDELIGPGGWRSPVNVSAAR
jgi:hypothetical protein